MAKKVAKKSVKVKPKAKSSKYPKRIWLSDDQDATGDLDFRAHCILRSSNGNWEIDLFDGVGSFSLLLPTFNEQQRKRSLKLLDKLQPLADFIKDARASITALDKKQAKESADFNKWLYSQRPLAKTKAKAKTRKK